MVHMHIWGRHSPGDEELPFEVYLCAIAFPIPEAADEALRQLIQATIGPTIRVSGKTFSGLERPCSGLPGHWGCRRQRRLGGASPSPSRSEA